MNIFAEGDGRVWYKVDRVEKISWVSAVLLWISGCGWNRQVVHLKRCEEQESDCGVGCVMLPEVYRVEVPAVEEVDR